MLTIAVLVFNVFHPGYCFTRPGIEKAGDYEDQTDKTPYVESKNETKASTHHSAYSSSGREPLAV